MSKYENLEIKIAGMWGIKATTIPMAIGSLRIKKKGMVKYTQKIPGDIKIQELQKITLFGTS